MNFRSRALLDLAYELECTLRIPGVCEGGTGEPAHANWSWAGKGAGIKAHDCFFASACRACHRALDQGSKLPEGDRMWFWLHGYASTMRQLWERGLLAVATEARTLSANATVYSRPTMHKGKRRATTAAANQVKRQPGYAR